MLMIICPDRSIYKRSPRLQLCGSKLVWYDMNTLLFFSFGGFMLKHLTLLCLFLLSSCARMESLNLRYHSYGKAPSKIVWFQFPGLTEEHLAMLRFSALDSVKLTSFEEASCVGKMWNYNLYNLRPNPSDGLLSQMVGSLNVQGNCEDFKQKPVWRYLQGLGVVTTILEAPMSPSMSVEKAWQCPETKDFTAQVSLWRMAPIPQKESPTFHYQDKEVVWEDKIIYDRSCQGASCFASITNNAFYLYGKLQKKSTKFIMIVRDFSYAEALAQKNITQAHEILAEWEKMFAYFQSEARQSEDMLVLITSSAPQSFEFPASGKEWEQFEKKGKNIIYHRPGLISSAWATGASAENFCGIYNEAEILERLLWQQGKEERLF
jgi:hypothetical protein